MKIVYLDPDHTVREVLPEATYEKGAAFWYGSEFAERCVEAPDDVEQGFVYDAENGTFSEPVLIAETPSQLDKIEAQVTYMAIMTDTLLEV